MILQRNLRTWNTLRLTPKDCSDKGDYRTPHELLETGNKVRYTVRNFWRKKKTT